VTELQEENVLMFGSGGSTNHTFTNDNSDVDIYYLNLF